MDDLESRLDTEGADIRTRAAAVARTEAALAALRTATHRRSPWMPRFAAVAAVAAAVVTLAFVVRNDDGHQSISSAGESTFAPTTVFSIPTVSTAATATTAAPTTTTPPETTVASGSTTEATLSTSTPFTRCEYTDPGKFPITVSRALACADGTEVDVTGEFVRDEDGVAWLCDQVAGSDEQPCVGDGLQLVGEPTAVVGAYSGIKQGNTLLIHQPYVPYVPSQPPFTEVPLTPTS